MPEEELASATMLVRVLWTNCALSCGRRLPDSTSSAEEPTVSKQSCLSGCELAFKTLKRGTEASNNVIKFEEEDFHRRILTEQEDTAVANKVVSLTRAMLQACRLECKSRQTLNTTAQCESGCSFLYDLLQPR